MYTRRSFLGAIGLPSFAAAAGLPLPLPRLTDTAGILEALAGHDGDRQAAVHGQLGGGGRGIHRQLHGRGSAISPVASGRPSSRFIHCTAPPAAPLIKLSITEWTTMWVLFWVMESRHWLVPTTSASWGGPSCTLTKGESA